MRKILFGTVAAIGLILTGLQGTAVAATPDLSTTTVRQSTITIDNATMDDDNFSNMPEMSHDDTPNE
jgi:hypothetical protein